MITCWMVVGAAWFDDLSLSPWTRNSSQSLLCTPPRLEEEKGGFKGVSRSAVGFAGAGWVVGGLGRKRAGLQLWPNPGLGKQSHITGCFNPTRHY